MTVHVGFKKLRAGVKHPEYATIGSAAMDVRASLPKGEAFIVVNPGERVLVGTGLAVFIPEKYQIKLYPRSGNSFKYGITNINAVGIIDSDYRDKEVFVSVVNHSDEDFIIVDGDKIAQMQIEPVFKDFVLHEMHDIEQMEGSTRVGGFGSTGMN